MYCYRCGHEDAQHAATGCLAVEFDGRWSCPCRRTSLDVAKDEEGRRKARAHLGAYVICRGCQRLLSENMPLPSRSHGDDSSCVAIGLDLCADCRAKEVQR